jgi:hypothetical protein
MVDNYKVRSKKADGNGGLITIQAAKASRTAAETGHSGDSDYGSDTGLVDIEKLNSSEAGYRGYATQITLAAAAVSVDNIDDKFSAAAALGDAASESTTTNIGAALLLYNGSTRDRARGNQDLTVFASAARTADPTAVIITNYNARGLHLVINVTATTSTPSVVFTIEGRDVLSGEYYTILASVAITAIGTTVLRIYPGLGASANVIANDVLPRTIRVKAVHADSDSITYSVGISLIL